MIKAQRPRGSLKDSFTPLLEKTDREFFQSFLRDASNFKGDCDKVVFPVTEEQVSRVLAEANAKKIPVTISGGRTGLTGACVPQEGIVLSLEKMTKIYQVEWDDLHGEGRAVVQPGVLLKDFEQTLDAAGLFFPPDPTEKTAFVGGLVATNASGGRSFKYGPVRRYVRRIRVVLSCGDILELRRGADAAKDDRFEVSLASGRLLAVKIPSYSMPKTKHVAGYFAEKGMDLIDLFIGSEGTLGVFTEIEFSILKKPEKFFSGIVFFASETDCYSFVKELRRLRGAGQNEERMDPRLLEFFDSKSLELLRHPYPRIPPPAGSALFFEQECSADSEERLLGTWYQALKGARALVDDSWISTQVKNQESFREFRHALPVLVNEEVARRGLRKLGTDMAVPDEAGEEMLRFYMKALAASGIKYVIFGHIGDNHLHVNLLPKSQDEFERGTALYLEFAKKAVAFGGTVAAEHGIGKMKIPFLEILYGREGLQQMAETKLALDPNGILGRGNMIPRDLLTLKTPA